MTQPHPSISFFTNLGLPSTIAKIGYGIAMSESHGIWGNLNTYDNQIVTWGAFQFSGLAGAVGAVLAKTQSLPGGRAMIDRYLTSNGLRVESNGDLVISKCSGWMTGSCPGGEGTIRAAANDKAGWEYLRTRFDLLGALYLFGTEDVAVAGMVAGWKTKFVDSALSRAWCSKCKELITSEYTLGRYLYRFNGLPSAATRAVRDFAASNPGPWSQSTLDQAATFIQGSQEFNRFDTALNAMGGLSHAPNSVRI